MPRYAPLNLVLRAVSRGFWGMLALPLLAIFLVLGVGHLQGDCGPGSSGGCEMGAVLVALYAMIPGFLLGAAASLVRDLWRRKA